MSSAQAFPTHTQVNLSPELLQSLDNSKDSAVSREYRSIQSKNSNNLNSLTEKANKNLLNLNNKILNSNPHYPENMNGAPELNQKLDSIFNNLKNSDQAKIAKSPELIAAENNVKSCLLKNKGKPLNCWDIVLDFKKIAGNP